MRTAAAFWSKRLLRISTFAQSLSKKALKNKDTNQNNQGHEKDKLAIKQNTDFSYGGSDTRSPSNSSA